MARWSIALVFLVLGGLAGIFFRITALQGQAPPAAVYPKELTSYRDVVKQVLPAVVSVESRSKPVAKSKQPATRQRRPSVEVPGLPDEVRKFFEDMEGFQVPQEAIPRHAFGSGFIIDPKGVILTNYHVVAGADRVEITMKDGRRFTSADIKGDRKNDLAIVRIKASTSLPYLELGDSDSMEIGDRVLAVGAPFGLTGSVTTGIVSAKGRSGLNQERVVYEDYLQTDAAINPGNSGGPLVNLEGRVVGINTAIKSETGGFQGVGLAITSNLAKNIVDQLIREGVVHRGYMGVSVSPLDPEVASRLGLKEGTGVLVAQVIKKTPASKAGIKPGDVILSVAGKPIKDGRELQHLIGTFPLRKAVEVEIIRDEKPQVVQVTIEEQPDRFGLVSRETSSREPQTHDNELSADKVGLDLADLTPELAARYGYPEDTHGVVITQVQSDGIAADSGLRRGMTIAKIDKKQPNSAAQAQQMLEKGNLDRGVLLEVRFMNRGDMVTSYLVLKAETADK